MTKKNPGSDTHDRKVRQLAKQYEIDKWKVKTYVGKYDSPSAVGKNNHIPDLEVTRRGKTKLIEVDLPDTVDSAQLKTFRMSAARKKNVEFEHVITKPRRKR
jgi:hypothetical protein